MTQKQKRKLSKSTKAFICVFVALVLVFSQTTFGFGVNGPKSTANNAANTAVNQAQNVNQPQSVAVDPTDDNGSADKQTQPEAEKKTENKADQNAEKKAEENADEMAEASKPAEISKTVDGVKVTVQANKKILAKGVDLQVKSVSAEAKANFQSLLEAEVGKKAESVKVFDLQLVAQDGTIIDTFESDVTVSYDVAGVDEGKVVTAHLSKDNKKIDYIAKGKKSVKVKHFSEDGYGIFPGEEPPAGAGIERIAGLPGSAKEISLTGVSGNSNVALRAYVDADNQFYLVVSTTKNNPKNFEYVQVGKYRSIGSATEGKEYVLWGNDRTMTFHCGSLDDPDIGPALESTGLVIWFKAPTGQGGNSWNIGNGEQGAVYAGVTIQYFDILTGSMIKAPVQKWNADGSIHRWTAGESYKDFVAENSPDMIGDYSYVSTDDPYGGIVPSGAGQILVKLYYNNPNAATVTVTGQTKTYDGVKADVSAQLINCPEGLKLSEYKLVEASGAKYEDRIDVTNGAVSVKVDPESMVVTDAKGNNVPVINKNGAYYLHQEDGGVSVDTRIWFVSDNVQITPAELTVVTPDATKSYDGTPLTAEGSVTGFVNNENATFTTTGTITEVGTTPNTYEIDWTGATAKESNYTVKETVGTLTITEFEGEVVVTTTGGTFTYDGQPHGATVKVEGLPSSYTVKTASSNATATHVAKQAVTATCDTLVILNQKGEDVTANLKNITYINGTIVITKTPLSVVTPSASKVYDGTALTAEGSVAGFVNNETATFTTTGAQTGVGSSTNTYKLVFDKTALETDYEVVESLGTLTVTQNTDEIVVTATGGTFTYDGQAHGATVTVSQLPTGYTLETATSDDTATHVAEGTVTATCDTLVIKNAQGEDVTNELNIRYVDGTIQINPATLTVATPDKSKVYDGTALTAEGTIDGFVNNETATFTTTGTQTAVGSSTNWYKIDWTGATATKTDYDVKAHLGTLTVTEYAGEIVVTTTGGTFPYDGQAHSATVSVSPLPAGYTLVKATSNDKATHVAEGVVPANCDALVIKNAQDEDVTGKLNITYVNDSIQITPATLAVATESASKVYDGTALTAEGAVTGLIGDETVAFAVAGAQVAVGTSDNTYKLEWTGTAAESDYTVSATVGKLTVTEYDGLITVDTIGGTFPYDGQTHVPVVNVSPLPAGYILEKAESYDTVQHVWEGEKTANCDELVIRNAQGQDVTHNLKIVYHHDYIKVTPLLLTVTTESASKIYDGTALTAPGKVSGFINNETATFTVTGTQTEVGTSNNTYKLEWNGSAKEDDYAVLEKIGKLTVTQNIDEITVTTTGGTFPYDSQAHGATVSVSPLPAGYTLEKAESNDTATHVADGIVTATCDTLVIKNAAGEDVTSQLNIKYVDDTIEITPVALSVNTPNASKVYDGTALTAEGTVTGFVNSETATFTTTGSQTEVGTSDNTYTLTFDQTATQSDYAVSETVGKLSVTEYEGQIVVTTTGGTFPYDGQAHGATVSVSPLPGGYNLVQATSNDTATHVADGTVTANCDTLVIKNAAGEDVTSQLQIEYVNDSIAIIPVTLTVVTPNAAKVYDGTALTAEGTVTGFVNNETATFATTGTQTVVGESANTYTLTFDKTAAQTDYTVNETIGKLTVTEYTGEIVVTTTGGTFTYDGKDHGADVAVAGLPAGYTLEKAESGAKATHVTDGTVVATCDTLVIKNVAGDDVTGKLNIRYVNGSIQISPAALSVVTPSASKVYDGKALTAAGNVSGFVNNETATFTTTGTQTAVGSSDNTYTLVFDKTAAQTDYAVSETIGKLTVTEYADQVVVTTTGGTYVYDGQAHGATVTVSPLPAGYTVDTAASAATATHVADGQVAATADQLIIRNAQHVDVTDQLNIQYVDGTIEITPRDVTLTSGSAQKRYDGTELTDHSVAVGGMDFVSGEGATFTVTGTQTLAGESQNAFEYTLSAGTQEADYSIVKNLGTLVVTPDPIDPHAVVNKTHDGKEYKLGETVQFQISVKNIFDAPKNITLEELEGVTLDQAEFKNVEPGATVTAKATYAITEADILAGTFKNVVTAKFEGGPGFKGEDDVTPEKPNGHIHITKVATSKPANGSAYLTGETISYEITATNTGNLTLANVVVIDELTGDNWNVGTFAPNETKTFTATHVVTEAEAAAGFVLNVATATGDSPDSKDPKIDPKDPKDVDPGKDEQPAGPNPKPVPPAPVPTPTPTPKPPYVPVISEIVDVLDNVTPMAGGDNDGCWVHYYIILGIIVTAIYSVAVAGRRQNYIRRLNKHDDDAMGKNIGQSAGQGNVAAPAGSQNPQMAMSEGLEA